MKRFLPTATLLLLPVAVVAFASDGPTPFEKGNKAFASDDYAGAVAAYHEQLETTGPNASLLFNLGNAHYRLGKYGPAILAYERALVLDPHAEDIRANLRLARRAATAFEDHSPPVWETPLFWLGFDEWLFVGLTCLMLLAVISLVHAFIGDRMPRAVVRLLVGASLALVLIAIIAVSTRRAELSRGIVITSDAKVRLSPFPSADVVATLPAGRAVHIGKKHGGYFRIKNGWIAATDARPVYRIEPE